MFDARRFLDCEFHNPADLFAFVTAYGVRRLTQHSVEKWFQRASIPGAWLPVLLALLEIDRGRPVSLAPYLKRGGA